MSTLALKLGKTILYKSWASFSPPSAIGHLYVIRMQEEIFTYARAQKVFLLQTLSKAFVAR